MLDWTRSPYVAAYFAFVDKKEKQVAIYQFDANKKYSISNESIKIIIEDEPIATHKRHYLQQSLYMLAVEKKRLDEMEGEYFVIKSIEESISGFQKNPDNKDTLKKYLIDSSLRIDFLKRLDQMNINQMSLFGDEKAMVETIAMRHFEFDGN